MIKDLPFPLRRFRTAGLLALAAFATPARAQDAPIWTVINLHPAGAEESRLCDVTGTEQVGTATFATLEHGALWSGSAARFVDLHQFLPAAYSDSIARAVWSDGTTTLVAGLARHAADNRLEAFLWRLAPVPAPAFSVEGKTVRKTTARQITLRGTATNAARVEVKRGRDPFIVAEVSPPARVVIHQSAQRD